MAFSKVAAIFGFNPSLGKWDRVVRLPWFLSNSSDITSPKTGVLIVNGWRSPKDYVTYPTFAQIDLATGRLRDYAIDVQEYTLVDASTAVFTDSRGDIARLDVDTSDVTILDGQAEVTQLTPSHGNVVWYATGTGVGKIDVATGAMTRFDYPPIVSTTPVPNRCVRGPMGGPCTYPCPTGVSSCLPKPTIPSVPVSTLTFDARGNVWAVTNLPGSPDPYSDVRESPSPLLPVLELKAAAS
jgi:hypothetical protein